MNQFLYILRRLGLSILTLLVIFTITFFLMNTIPGGPFLGEKKLPPAILHNLEVKFGLNEPLGVQYINYFKNAVHGDFGVSIKLQGRSVGDIIATYFPVSAKLGLLSIAIAMIIGTLLGILSALKNNKFADRAVMVVSTIGTSVPSFVVATVSMVLFGVIFQILPTYGLDSVQSYILPAFALSLFPLSFASRLMRSSMLDVVNQDYIKTARAKGLKESTVIFKHALRNAILPVVTYLGPLLAGVLTGSFIIEKVFTIPGLGKFFIDSISNRDYPVILGTTIFYGAFLIGINFIVDIIYMFIDPRIKLKD
jgi:ABC-type dipeptide/oligopeptide/nickel transport system permease component